MALELKNILPYNKEWMEEMLKEVISASQFIRDVLNALEKEIRQSKGFKARKSNIKLIISPFAEEVPQCIVQEQLEAYLTKKVKEICKNENNLTFVKKKKAELEELLRELDRLEAVFSDQFAVKCGEED